MTRVKICGIQKLDDALVAAQEGADYVGLVFVPGRRRRLEVTAAQTISVGLKDQVPRRWGGHPPQLVGLFADQPLEELNYTIAACGLDVAQLCGKESLDYCRQVQARVIKVFHIADTTSLTLSPSQREVSNVDQMASHIRSYQESGHLATLDRLVEGLQGGTGQAFDWSIAAALSRQGVEFLLAGGLTPENVTQAVTTVQPWGVDVSSGVETEGAKDSARIRAFIRNARSKEVRHEIGS